MWKWYFYFFHKTERLSIISPIYESFYLCFGPPPHFSWSFSFRLYLLWSQLNAIQYSVVIAQHNKLLTTWDAGKKEKKTIKFLKCCNRDRLKYPCRQLLFCLDSLMAVLVSFVWIAMEYLCAMLVACFGCLFYLLVAWLFFSFCLQISACCLFNVACVWRRTWLTKL